MVVKVYISGISGNKEVKKRQQRVSMILDSKNIKYDIIDITEPGRESDKDFMQNNAKSNGGTVSDPNPRSPLPPQLFNDEEYCGDYDQFDLANEVDTLEQFLKLELPPEEPSQSEKEKTINGEVDGAESSQEAKENSQEKGTGVSNETGEKEPSPVKEVPAPKASSPTKEATPVEDESTGPLSEQIDVNHVEVKAESSVKEDSPDKEKSSEKQKSPDEEQSPIKSDEGTAKESSESAEVNGAVSSHEQSEEKQTDEEHTGKTEIKVDDPSLLLIQNEQAAAE